ncbi:MAG: TetR/AcrR family transcriptional regulator [Clostridium sp.]
MKSTGKDRILESAKQLISEKGIAQTSVREIAKVAGVTTGAIYHHYKNKEELLYAVMNTSLSESHKILENCTNNSTNYDILEDVIKSFTDRFNKESENKIQLYLTVLGLEGNEEVKNKISCTYTTWISDIAKLITLAYNDITLDKADTLGTILLATIDGLVLQELISGNVSSNKNIIDVFDVLLKKAIPEVIKHI